MQAKHKILFPDLSFLVTDFYDLFDIQNSRENRSENRQNARCMGTREPLAPAAGYGLLALFVYPTFSLT